MPTRTAIVRAWFLVPDPRSLASLHEPPGARTDADASVRVCVRVCVCVCVRVCVCVCRYVIIFGGGSAAACHADVWVLDTQGPSGPAWITVKQAGHKVRPEGTEH